MAEDLAAGRAAFLRYADAFTNAEDSDAAKKVADAAPKAIAEAYSGRTVEAETTPFGELRKAMREAVHG